ncbi:MULTISPECIES: low molecular weight phosphatase family protein [Brevibacterium]|uniref:Arsenate-mycothiol transferase n=1 Tax=Brevibacterium aurantiacum TaxID=273384 RepID=A0A2H1IKZ6_BREAU|nr:MULTISPECIES: low molecular weight phosphatase family protein [Brevibacterium]SMX75843.1 arsenate-mycothiol transferase [Brevibacterium aurantiacum]
METPPRVLFVCVKNGGKSQMAAGLMSDIAGASVEVVSGGTKPGTSLNQLSVDSLAEWGIDISEGSPKPITEADLAAADVVVTLGREAKVGAPEGTEVENWDTDEPSERGIEGIERMRLVRDDISARTKELLNRLRP